MKVKVTIMGELRKVQQTPGGTFFVCLPKAWAERQGLKRGAAIAVAESSDGRLFIDAAYSSEPSPRAVTLTPSLYLSREIVGKYLLGFDIINVEAKEGVSFEVRETVKSTVSRLIGLEIVEEDYSRIVLQCLLEPSGFPPEKILRRSYAIAASMHRDAIKAFVDRDIHLAKNIIARDDEVNRLYFLSVRILRTIIQNPSLSEKLGVRPIECLDYRLVVSMVEAIGDECVRIAMKIAELKDIDISKDLKKLFVDFHAICFEAHENALKAFFSGDVSQAEEVRKTREKIEKTLDQIERVAKIQSLDIVPYVLAASSNLKQIYEHSVDIADLVMPKKM